MKNVLISLALVFALPAWSMQCDMQKDMTWHQWYNVSKAYHIGLDHDFGLTMAAIVIKESSAGLYKINPDSNDYGLTQINIDTAMNRTETQDRGMNKVVLASKLVEDDDLSLALALEELLYWNDYHNENWPMVVKSYNAGFNPSAAKGYYKHVSNLVTQLRECFPNKHVPIQERFFSVYRKDQAQP